MNREIIQRLEESFSEVELRDSVKALEERQRRTSATLEQLESRLLGALNTLQWSRRMAEEPAKLEDTEPKK